MLNGIRIAVLPGDGIGPEVTEQAVRTLDAALTRFGHAFTFAHGAIGGAALDAAGTPLPTATVELCERSDAVLLGAVGGPRWDSAEPAMRPERGLLELRGRLGAFANIRPVRTHPSCLDRGPLRPEVVRGVDLVVVRELTGGIYYGRRGTSEHEAFDECRYTSEEIARVARVACRIASGRLGRLVSLDKANVLETSRLWRRTVERVARDEFPEIGVEHMLIDAAAMHLIADPVRFDVIVTENLFGDIVSDEASVLAGSIGLLGSASIGADRPGIFEPIHGSAPDIAGSGVANPLGAIAAAEMLLDTGLGLGREARAVRAATDATITLGRVTRDLGGEASTSQVGAAVAEAVLNDV